MTLLIIVAALLVGHYMQWPQRLRDFGWYLRHFAWLGARVDLRGVWGVLLALTVPVLATLAVQALLGRGTGQALGAVFAWLVLLYCLGPDNLLALINDLIDALDAGDASRADELQARLGGDAESQADGIAASVAIQAHEQYFAILFWFGLLGPAGAVLYRFTRCLAELPSLDERLRPAALHLLGILGWPSARLAAFGFALMGNFDKAVFKLTAGIAWQPDLVTGNRGLLAEVVGAATEMPPGSDAAAVLRRVKALVMRTFSLWLVGIALLTLIRW